MCSFAFNVHVLLLSTATYTKGVKKLKKFLENSTLLEKSDTFRTLILDDQNDRSQDDGIFLQPAEEPNVAKKVTEELREGPSNMNNNELRARNDSKSRDKG